MNEEEKNDEMMKREKLLHIHPSSARAHTNPLQLSPQL